MATAAGSARKGGGGRFAAACGVLSRYVREAERSASAVAAEARPVVALPLMPGADVSSSAAKEECQGQAGPAPAPAAQAQLTICYGGRAVVIDEFPADRATVLLRLAAAASSQVGAGTSGQQQVLPPVAAVDDDVPMARKASLQRFMEKRKGRAAALGAPYRRPEGVAGADAACPDDRLALALAL